MADKFSITITGATMRELRDGLRAMLERFEEPAPTQQQQLETPAPAQKREDAPTQQLETPEPKREDAPTPKLEDVRAVLVEAAKAAGGEPVRALLGKYGATRLQDVDPGRFAELLQDAYSLRDGVAF